MVAITYLWWEFSTFYVLCNTNFQDQGQAITKMLFSNQNYFIFSEQIVYEMCTSIATRPWRPLKLLGKVTCNFPECNQPNTDLMKEFTLKCFKNLFNLYQYLRHLLCDLHIFNSVPQLLSLSLSYFFSH